MKKKVDQGVPARKASPSVSGSKSSAKKRPGFPPPTSRGVVPGDHPPMYAVRWNKLIDIITGIAIEQADRERSGHAWGQDTIDQLDALRDPFALGARSKPTKEAVPAPRGTGAKRSAKSTGASRATPKKKHR